MRYLLLIGLLFVGCNHMLNGGPPPDVKSHFIVGVRNNDAVVTTASLCWWANSAYVGSRDQLVAPGSEVLFDLGTVHPDGIQLVMGSAIQGILQGPGGLVFSGPEINDTWDPVIDYPQKTLTK